MTAVAIIARMPTLAELLLSLITDQPLSRSEKWSVAVHIVRLHCALGATASPPLGPISLQGGADGGRE